MDYSSHNQRLMELLLLEGEVVELKGEDILDAHAVLHDRLMEHGVHESEAREYFIDALMEPIILVTSNEKISGGFVRQHNFLSIDA